MNKQKYVLCDYETVKNIAELEVYYNDMINNKDEDSIQLLIETCSKFIGTTTKLVNINKQFNEINQSE